MTPNSHSLVYSKRYGDTCRNATSTKPLAATYFHVSRPLLVYKVELSLHSETESSSLKRVEEGHA